MVMCFYPQFYKRNDHDDDDDDDDGDDDDDYDDDGDDDDDDDDDIREFWVELAGTNHAQVVVSYKTRAQEF